MPKSAILHWGFTDQGLNLTVQYNLSRAHSGGGEWASRHVALTHTKAPQSTSVTSVEAWSEWKLESNSPTNSTQYETLSSILPSGFPCHPKDSKMKSISNRDATSQAASCVAQKLPQEREGAHCCCLLSFGPGKQEGTEAQPGAVLAWKCCRDWSRPISFAGASWKSPMLPRATWGRTDTKKLA